MEKNERRICWYSSLLIALMMNMPKLLALREHGIVARYYHFNSYEFFFQLGFNIFFCASFFYFNLKPNARGSIYRKQRQYFSYFSINILSFSAAFILGGLVQYSLFPDQHLLRFYLFAYFMRLGMSGILVGILIKIVLLIREAREKGLENEQLKTAYMETELELLKEQMNPHFLFNSLSSLSGVIRENPNLAQKYVRDLSTVFRYVLVRSKNNLVTVEVELSMLHSFAQLIAMRLENAFQLTVKVDQKYLSAQIPHLSLQPLLENAIKHNAATIDQPLVVTIYVDNNELVLSNTLAEIPTPESSNGLGLANLNERFKIMVQQEITILKTDTLFTVKLPLKG